MTRCASRVRRSQADRDRLVEQYLPLVRHIVARLPVTMPAMLSRDDFYATGVIGLIHAATTYDPNRGASFKTFAYTAIRGAILDEIRKHDPVPRNRRDRLRTLERTSRDLYAELQREPTMVELAEVMQVLPEDLDEDLRALHTARTLSLDETASHEDGEMVMSSLISDARSSDPGDQAASRERLERLTKAISELPETDRNVVVLYYHEQLYLKEIGRILGVTESRISQILSRALERLRQKLGQEELEVAG